MSQRVEELQYSRGDKEGEGTSRVPSVVQTRQIRREVTSGDRRKTASGWLFLDILLYISRTLT